MRRTSLDRMREDLRLQLVYNTLLRYGMDVVLERTPYVGGFRHALQTWVWRLPKGWEEPPAPVRLRMMLEELGPTYVKIGQIVSSQASTLPVDIATELEKLQDDVPPFPSDQVRVTIIEELGAPPEELYDSFEPEPFAAASTAQVHRAFLHDGTKVAVKVQRPQIVPKIRSDLGILQNAARVASQRSEMVRTLDVSGMLEQFSAGVLEELDYRGETYNALQLAKNMEGLPGIHVPVIYTELSTSKIITQEFVEGVKVSDVEAIEAAGLDREEIARNALRALIKQLPVDGFFHADPHPGNLLVNLDTGVLTFIDLGMMGELDVQQAPAARPADGRRPAGQRRGHGVGAARHERADRRRGGREGVPAGLRAPDGPLHGRRARSRRSGRSPTRGSRCSACTACASTPTSRWRSRRWCRRRAWPRALSTGSGLHQRGRADARATWSLREHHRREDPGDRHEAGHAVGRRRDRAACPSLSDATMSWLDQYQKGRFEVTVDTSQLSKEVGKLTRLGREIVIAVMLVGMLVGSAIASYGIAALDLETVGLGPPSSGWRSSASCWRSS